MLDPIKTEASDAATAAAEAAGDASDAADAAEDAIVGRAMYQTGEANSDDHAKDARTQADTAATEAGNAMTASGLAQAATNANDARAHRKDAEDAQEAAETAQGMAEEQRDMAEADAEEEVFVDGKTKSVGGKSVTFEGGRNPSSPMATPVVTGKHDEITDMSDVVPAIRQTETAIPTGTPPVAAVIAKPAIASREIILGQVYDSDEDDARVALIHSYIGTKTVNAFFEALSPTSLADIDGAGVDRRMTTSCAATDSLRVRAASGTFVVTDQSVDETGTILDDADEDGVSLYFYVDRKDEADSDDDVTTYLRRVNTGTAADGTVTHNYVEVSVKRGVKKFPEAAKYDHFHFGVWADLEEANTAGENDARPISESAGSTVLRRWPHDRGLDDVPNARRCHVQRQLGRLPCRRQTKTAMGAGNARMTGTVRT